MMTVRQPFEYDIRFVLTNLRELDRRELTATGCRLEQLPPFLLSASAFCFVAVDDYAMPQAVWGMVPTRKGVGNGYAFGTENWGKALPAIMRNIKGFVLPFLLQHNFHRIECSALSHRKDVARFLAMIGARPEALMQQWGTRGEDFTSYRWLADEHRAKTQAQGHHTGH
jgi:hypothetical protein